MARLGRKIVAAAAVILAASFLLYLLTPGRPDGGLFVVSEGESIDGIVDRLVEDGYVRSRTLFRLSLLRSGLATRIQPGEHVLTGVGSYGDIARRLAEVGAADREVTLLLREGETLRELHDSLESLGLNQAAADLYFLTGQPAAVAGSDSPAMERLRGEYPFLSDVPSGRGLEGYLFPDTYRLYSDASTSDVVHRLLDNFGRRVGPEIEAGAQNEGRTMFEVVTMASVLEREVRGGEDMRLAADLFWRRLDAGMPLQADSTVNYATGGSRPSVSYDDTRIDSPFNTYLYRGLPAGPIGNPGLEALRAAVDPEPNDYWYFLTDASGSVHYARSLSEHNSNKSRFLNR